MSYYDNQGNWRMPWDPPPAQTRRSGLWTSLERAPTLAEARELVRRGVRFADFDLRQGMSPETARVLREAGISIFAYDIGNGGGRAWGEPLGLNQGPQGVQRIYNATRTAIQRGADGIHLDNPDKLSRDQLEKLMDAQVRAARSLGREPVLHLKNAPEAYLEILNRRVDLRSYVKVAVVEHLMSRPNAAKQLASMGIPVYGIEFERSSFGSPTRSAAATKAYFQNNPWVSGMISMPNEKNYESRGAQHHMRDGMHPLSPNMDLRRTPQMPAMADRPHPHAHLPPRPAQLAEYGRPHTMYGAPSHHMHTPYFYGGDDMGRNNRGRGPARGRTPVGPPDDPGMMDPALMDGVDKDGRPLQPAHMGPPPGYGMPARAPAYGAHLHGPPPMVDPRMMPGRDKDGSPLGGHPHAHGPHGHPHDHGHMPPGGVDKDGTPLPGGPPVAAGGQIGFQRFGDFMKEVMGVPHAGAPGFRAYQPINPAELGTIGQMLGIDPATMRGADGQYSDATRARVAAISEKAKEFQAQAGLPVDGVIGSRTGPAMMNTPALDFILNSGRAAAPAPGVGPQVGPQTGPAAGGVSAAHLKHLPPIVGDTRTSVAAPNTGSSGHLPPPV